MIVCRPLNKVFLSPWVEEPCDVQAVQHRLGPNGEPLDTKELGWVPDCYKKITTVPPLTNKLSTFTDDTLLYLFYKQSLDVDTLILNAQEL
jgi:hypothetical protein